MATYSPLLLLVEAVPPGLGATCAGKELKLNVRGYVPGAKEAKDLLELPTDRIGHGTCLHPDRGGSQELLDIVEKHAIPLELCLSSNVQCHTVSSYDDHHMWHWYNTNHPFVICVRTTLNHPFVIECNYNTNHPFVNNVSTTPIIPLSIMCKYTTNHPFVICESTPPIIPLSYVCKYNTNHPFVICVSTTPIIPLSYVCKYNTNHPFVICVSTPPIIHFVICVKVHHQSSLCHMCKNNTNHPFVIDVNTTPIIPLSYVKVQHQ
ncbi:predicted protein [Nematostella vectensis]|uniref:Adenosine deaminase domain-containing protein n=1 Tax=Nematostella vectensis TaxID=45351 RepID=A7SPK9_NEMVE|nr:predicted protein [Nematostella vectensis]|eukprot:XP_001626439.1 predicted protein [Nematostella vectensis]